jgi:hypothetical protein
LRYLGTTITGYLHSQRTCDKFCQSCLGSSSSLPCVGLSRGKSLFYFAPER